MIFKDRSNNIIKTLFLQDGDVNVKKLWIVAICIGLGCLIAGCNQTTTTMTPPPVPPAREEPEPTQSREIQLDMRKETVKDMIVEIPAAAQKINDVSDNIQYRIQGEGGEESWLASFSLHELKFITSSEDLVNNADILWEAVKSRLSNMSNEEKAAFKVDGIDVVSYHADAYLDGNNYYIDILYFFLNNRTHSIIMLQDYRQEYIPYFEQMIETMEFEEHGVDFLTDHKNRRLLDYYNQHLQFDKILEMVDEYIEQNMPAENDCVYAIREAAAAANTAMNACHFVSDEFEGNGTLYGGVDQISAEVHFVPYIDTQDSSYSYLASYLSAKIGVQEPDWPFIKRIKIKVGADAYIEYSFQSQNDLKKGSIVKETYMTLVPQQVEQLLTAEATPIMRFTSENDETFDCEMSANELESLKNIYPVMSNRKAIADIISEWEDLYA